MGHYSVMHEYETIQIFSSFECFIQIFMFYGAGGIEAGGDPGSPPSL